jgi:hypothetical protein
MLTEVTNLQQQPASNARNIKAKQAPVRRPSMFKLGLATLPAGPQLNERVVRQGSLNKLSTSSTLKRWQNRKFALTTNGSLDGCLLKYCYPEDQACGAQHMLNVRGAVELSKCSCVEAAGNSIKFEMENGSGSLKVKASSASKAKAWVNDIKAVFAFYQDRASSSSRAAQDHELASHKDQCIDLAFHERRAALNMVTHIQLLPFSPRHQAKNSASSFAAVIAPSFSSHVLQARISSIDGLWQQLRACRPTLRQHSAQALTLAKHGYFPHAPANAKVFMQGFKTNTGTSTAKHARAFEKRHSRMSAQPSAFDWNHTRLVTRWFSGASSSSYATSSSRRR